ncbi:alpha/beta hydrolase [Streptomyces sp. BH106]|uniref:alpha/beta hydrolase n=1 Tax=Streptomyces sp. BH106 TaxID=3410409 RepID=UPI003CFA652F
MGLTSKKLLALALLAAFLIFAGIVWLWPRLAGRGVRRVLGRIGSLLLTQVLMITALGLFLNQYFGFYGSWDDLLGTAHEPVTVTGHDALAKPGLRVTGSRRMATAGADVPSVAGRIEEVTIRGAASGITSSGYVYLPPEYFQRAYATRKFSSVLVLTGYPGVTLALIKGLQYPQIEHRLIAQGKMPPTVLVMMRPTLVPPRDTECMDIPKGPRTETFFTRDLTQLVSGHYRVGVQARDWGVMGDSTGGYCALKMTMRHPRAFSAAVGLSPSYRAPIDLTTGDLFGGSKRLKSENNLMWRLGHKPSPPVSLLVTSSRHGEHDYKATMHFIQKIKQLDERGAPTHVFSIILGTGGHNFNTWRREIPAALEWLGGRLDGPASVREVR